MIAGPDVVLTDRYGLDDGFGFVRRGTSLDSHSPIHLDESAAFQRYVHITERQHVALLLSSSFPFPLFLLQK